MEDWLFSKSMKSDRTISWGGGYFAKVKSYEKVTNIRNKMKANKK